MAQPLLNRVDSQPEPRGAVLPGGFGVRLQRDPDRTVGVDLVDLAQDTSARVEADDSTTIIDGVPSLAVEILSPSDTMDEIELKIDIFRDAGVPVVWVMNPNRRTVTVFRCGQDSAAPRG